MATAVVEQHGGEVPTTMEALVELPGVGRKTANVVLGHALGVPGTAGRSPRAARLEPHRHRARPTIRRSSNSSCARRCRRPKWIVTSDTLILHGRRICKPRPLCDRCAVRDDCDYYRAVARRCHAAAKSQSPVVRKRRRRAKRRPRGRQSASSEAGASSHHDSRALHARWSKRRSARFPSASAPR